MFDILGHGAAVVSTVALQQEGCGFDSQSGLLVWRLHVLPVSAWVISGYP